MSGPDVSGPDVSGAGGGGRLPAGAVDDLLERVAADDAARLAAWPGERLGRQPVQTLYVPGERFASWTARGAGAEASRLLESHAPGAAALADATGIDPALAAEVRQRVVEKLATEPVEDVRCDFEDGYRGDGLREDADALAAGRTLAAARAAGTLPPFCGVRVKPFCDGHAARSIRTLDLVLDGLLAPGDGLPGGFAVTFPKVVATGHVEAFAEVLGRLEEAYGLPTGALRFEIQVETPQSLVDRRGAAALRAFVDAAGGRLRGAHFGVYDYTAALGLDPAAQRLDHAACDAARHVMQVTLAGTGVWLSDGATNLVPSTGTSAEVRSVWRRHAADARRSRSLGFRQGWDMHPAHLVSRYAVVYADLLDGLDGVCDRLARWYGRPGAGGYDATVGGAALVDEPATVRALLTKLRLAVECGAADEAEVCVRAGLEPGTCLHHEGG